MLIKICKINKTHNEEKIPQLIQECNNFKKMIKLETDAIVHFQVKIDQLKKLKKKFLANLDQQLEN